MSRCWFALPAVAVVIVAACSSGAAAATSPTQAATAGASAASSAGSAAPAPPTPAASLAAIGAGEPWLLYSRKSDDGSDFTARLVRPDGSGDHAILADVPGDLRAPVWSPNGKQIAFVVRDATTDGTIWTANADGTGAAKFYDGRSDGCGSVFYPAWSPDGTRMALVCYVEHGTDTSVHSQLAMLDLGSRHLTTIVDLAWPDFLDDPIRWSHDGKTLAFAILHWDPTNAFLDGSLVATVPGDGGGKPRRLTDMKSFATYPDWSGDDRSLVYNTYDTGAMHDASLVSNLFTIAADGNKVHQLTTAESGSGLRIAEPRWDPSGSRIWVLVKQGADRPYPGWVDPSTGKVTTLEAIGHGSNPEPRPHP